MSETGEIAREEGRLGRLVDAGASALAFVGGLFLLFIVVLTCVSIAGRALLTVDLCCGPVPGDVEMIEIASGVAVFLFLPFCQLKRGHVTVDIFSGPMGARGVAFTDLLGNLLMAAAAVVILWRLELGFQDKLRSGETTFILGLPLWWGYALSLVGAAAFALVSAYTVLRSLGELRAGRLPPAHHLG
ncbi:TRAP transporter small permease [Jiella sonneratiae]|uniref:TRAP transporter small permease protein n=1 Tax=Jiella sonneratiae TaxID=2816856 RepID=A0ABS3J361_9HYPH|nr:TRAP transporter small permease [Jiella sonneratiae]MBO0904092.1 TRAP transporter small permease [Jiella sonneratiae]